MHVTAETVQPLAERSDDRADRRAHVRVRTLGLQSELSDHLAQRLRGDYGGGDRRGRARLEGARGNQELERTTNNLSLLHSERAKNQILGSFSFDPL